MMELFNRQIPVISSQCQERIRTSKVLIAGIGGLGSAVAEILIRNGIGELYVVDDDIIDETNIHRQILYTLEDIGKKKVDVAKRRLQEVGFNTKIHTIFQKIEKEFQLPKADVVVDCLDNAASKNLLSEMSSKNKIPFVHGGVNGYFGQVSTLKGKSLASVFSFPKEERKVSVILQTIFLTASIQAMEVLNLICDKPINLVGKILFLDIMNYDFEVVNVENV